MLQMAISLKEAKAKGYKSITYKEFWTLRKINEQNINKLKDICEKYSAIVDESKKEIWFGGLEEHTKDFFTDLDRLVGNIMI
jgi:hypothetical protein